MNDGSNNCERKCVSRFFNIRSRLLLLLLLLNRNTFHVTEAVSYIVLNHKVYCVIILLSSLPPPALSLFPLFAGIPVPVAPAGHPSLLSNNVLAGGGYNISLRPINETVMEASATTVLIKIQSGQSTYYLWEVNILSLSLLCSSHCHSLSHCHL